MAKKRNLKREKAERNREYARQFQRNRSRNQRRQRSANTSEGGKEEEGAADTDSAEL